MKLRSYRWATNNGIHSSNLKNLPIYFGIIDARHMLAEPEIFFNEALPYLVPHSHEKDESKKNLPGKCLFGRQNFILVQYPQFFSNVSTQSDHLDNRNAGYYTLWQSLRDCAKVITSSGTNAVWNISDPSFSFATTSRIEDTGTSHKYIGSYLTVHIPCFVAHGIAKETQDYVEVAMVKIYFNMLSILYIYIKLYDYLYRVSYFNMPSILYIYINIC